MLLERSTLQISPALGVLKERIHCLLRMSFELIALMKRSALVDHVWYQEKRTGD